MVTSCRDRLDFSLVRSCVLLNPGDIITGEVGVRASAATFDVPLIRLIENIRTWTDFSGIVSLNLETVRLLFHL